MSECTGSRCDKKEDIRVLLSKKDAGESPQHKQYLWMAHWTKASSSVEPLNDMISNSLKDVSKGNGTKLMKSAVAERLMVGVSHGSASVQHAQKFSSDMWGAAHNVSEDTGPTGNKHCHESFERSMKKKDVNLLARSVVSETYSIHKLSELPVDFQKYGSSNPTSDWSHFPMFEINRQIDNILNPKRRSAIGPASLNVNMSTAHVMELSSQEYRMSSHRITDENVDICKSAGGVVSHLKDPAGLSTDPSSCQKLKGLLSDTMSCSCSKDETDSSNYLIDEQQTNHYFVNSKQDPPYASNRKKFKFAGHKKNQIGVHKQQNAEGVMFCAPVISSEFQNEPTNCSNSRKMDGVHNIHKSHGNIVSGSLLPYERQHLRTCRKESPEILKDSCMSLDPISKTPKANSNGDPLAHVTESRKKSTVSCSQRGPCLFEKLTIPSKSQSAKPVSSGKSSGLGVCMYGTNIGSRLFGAQNQSSTRTETLYSDTLIVSKSSAGIASPSAQKDHGCPNKATTEQVAIPSIRGDSGHKMENRFSHVNEHHDVSSKATIASKQSYLPGSGNTNLDLMLFQMGRMRNRISSGMVQSQVVAKPTDRWLKRLRLDIPVPEIPNSKRSKFRDGPPLETNCLFDMALHCNNRDTEMMDRFKEGQVSDEVIKFQDNQEMPPVPAKSMNYWIGRWCQGGIPVLHGVQDQGRPATKPDQASEELGGQFPSIGAMAMMGRAMNKLRPCEHQRKGPFVVWKTE
ncbi:hypothetical protein ACP4OV_021565 [Aristida adscensionis]